MLLTYGQVSNPMPKRSNSFQDLVTLIQEALAPLGATVTPSAMVPSRTSGNLREIDVLVETSVGPYSIKIAVEAKDERRKLDATKIEAIIGKYRGNGALQVNKIVVIARNDYTPEARTRARDEDIDLLTVIEATSCQWYRLVPQSFQLNHPPIPVGFDLYPKLPKVVLESKWMQESRFICLCHGYDYGSPQFKMQQVLLHIVLPNKLVVDKMHDAAKNGGTGKSELHITMPVKNYVLRFGGKDYPAESATLHYRCVHATGLLTSSVYKLEDETGSQTAFVHSEGTVGGNKIKILMPLDRLDSRGIIKIESPPRSDDATKGHSWTLINGVWVESSTNQETDEVG